VKYADRYNLSHPLLDDFRRSWAQLTFMPIDPQTSSLEVYRGIPFTIPHRHYSHLFSVWPLHIGDMRDPWWHGVAQRSVDVWLNNPASDSEFFRPVASKMSTLLNRAGAAYGNISTLINNVFFVHSNTFYGESGGPCTETPYAAAWAVSELLLQSWNSSLDFFPAVPDVIEVPTKRRPLESDENDDDGNFQLAGLAGASFFRLRTMGGFLASAIRTIEATNATHIVSTTSMLAVERAPSLKHVRRGVDTQIVLRTSMARPLRAVNCDSLAIIDDVVETGDDYVALGLAQSVQCAVLLRQAGNNTLLVHAMKMSIA
jgi:hypothetical protein